uniref:hypothetical protein n=1 Tax=Thermogutta sp. TaxID=1962930 RepID=UPI00321FB449
MVNIFRKKAKQNAERFFLHLFPSGSIPPRRGTYEVIRNYRNLPWLFACATKIANSVASVQWEAFVAREEGKAVKTRVIGNTPEERVKHLRR